MTAPHLTAEETTPHLSVWAPPYRALTIGLMLTITAAAFETLAVSTILPSITRELDGLALYGWAFSAFLLTRLVGTTLAGSEVDRQGPLIPFLIGTGLFLVGLLTAGLAPSMAVLIAGRTIQGFGSGVIGSVTYAIIARGYPESVRPRMLALTSTAWVVPGLIGPAIAGVIGDYVGWRWVFLGLVPIPLLAVVLSRQSLHGLTRTSDQPRDWSQVLRSVRLALGVTLLTIGLGTALPWGLLIVAASLVLAIPALQKLLPTGTLRAAAGLPAAVACMGLLSLCFFGVDVFIPLALTSVRGLPAVIAGLALTSATVTWTAGSWMLDRLVDRYSRRMFGAVGMVLIIIGIGLSLLMLNPLVPALLGVLAWGVAGLGIGLTYTTLSLATLDLAPKGQEGLSAASLQVNDTLGSAIGTGLGGVIIASYGAAGKVAALETQFVLMLAVAVLGLVVALRLPGQRKSTD